MKANRERGKLSPEELPESTQEQLACILDDYLLAAEQGSPITPDELLRRHPENAEYLRDYLSGLQLFHEAAHAQELQPDAVVENDPRPSRTLGDFQLLREIGRGGMGIVYEAMQISLQRRVALKILPHAIGRDKKQIGRFKNEAKAAASIEHPNIVPVFAVGEESGEHYYAMQYIHGQSLDTMLSKLHSQASPSKQEHKATYQAKTIQYNEVDMSPTLADRVSNRPPGPTMSIDGCNDHVRSIARAGISAARALHAAHEYGIVHRDIKPSNLLIDDDGKLWVTDFGLARCRSQDGLTQSGEVVGTMRYMSPEQALGQRGMVDHRTDIYSLGVTLYELASLHHPAGDVSDVELLFNRAKFSHIRLRSWNRHIPLDFETIIMKAISEDATERYATAQEFADDLDRFLEGKAIHASSPSILKRAGKWARRHRSVVYAAAAILLLTFIGQSYNTLLLARKNAEKERALEIAQEHLHQAHSVLDRFGTKLVDQLAAIPGAEGVRYQLLEDSIDLYKEFEQKAAHTPTLATDLADAHSKMGGLTERMGKKEAALKEHLAALSIWQNQVKEEPSNPETAAKLASCHNNIGLLLADLERGDEALTALNQAEQIQRTLLSQEPDSTVILADIAVTTNNLGLVYRQLGQREEAIKQFRDAISLQESLKSESPQSESLLRCLAASYSNLGSLVAATSSEEASNAYQRAIVIQRQLVMNHPVNRIYQGELARTYNNLGFLLAGDQEWENAELCYMDAVGIQENLVKSSPMAASYRRDLAISHNNLGMVQSHANRYSDAEESFWRAIELQQTLQAVEPTDSSTCSNLGSFYNNLGLLFDSQGRFGDAEEAFRDAVRHQRQASEHASTTDSYRELLSNHLANYEACLRNQAKTETADQLARERNSLRAHQ